MFVISTKCGVAARMEKSISKARFLDVARNDISKKFVRKMNKIIIKSRKTVAFARRRRHNAPKEQDGLCAACMKGVFVSTRLRSTAAATRRQRNVAPRRENFFAAGRFKYIN